MALAYLIYLLAHHPDMPSVSHVVAPSIVTMSADLLRLQLRRRLVLLNAA